MNKSLELNLKVLGFNIFLIIAIIAFFLVFVGGELREILTLESLRIILLYFIIPLTIVSITTTFLELKKSKLSIWSTLLVIPYMIIVTLFFSNFMFHKEFGGFFIYVIAVFAVVDLFIGFLESLYISKKVNR